MKSLIAVLATVIIIGCKKSTSEDPFVTCIQPTQMAWLDNKKAEYKNCDVCGAEFQYGIYNGKPVVEIRINSSLTTACDGINIVYNLDGSILLSSYNYQAYIQYLASVQQNQIIWSCKSGGQG